MNERHTIRVGTLGWDRDVAAKNLDDASLGIGLQWVEIDGARLPDGLVSGCDITTDGGSFMQLTLRLIGRVEIVYVDEAGKPLRRKARRRAEKAARA